MCFPPIEEFQYTIGPTPSFLKAEDPIVEAEDKTDKIDGDQKTNKISSNSKHKNSKKESEKQNNWSLFFLAFFSGFAALLTHVFFQ